MPPNRTSSSAHPTTTGLLSTFSNLSATTIRNSSKSLGWLLAAAATERRAVAQAQGSRQKGCAGGGREAGQGARSRDQANGSRLWGYARPMAAHGARSRLRSLLGAFKRRSPAGCRGRAPVRGRARGPAARRWAVAATGRALHTLLATHCIAAVVCEQRGILRLCLEVWAGGL